MLRTTTTLVWLALLLFSCFLTTNAAVEKTAAVIFLHGLGDNGDGWSFLEKQFARSMPYVDWEFPTAPTMPVTIAGGRAMNAWFDAIHRPAPWKKSTENLDPTRSNQARGMTQQETAKAKKWSIPRRKINSQREDIQGLEKTVAFVNRLIAKKIAQGIPADRIIVGGFSQGAVVSILSCLANAHAPLAGCVCVSGWFAAPNHFLPDGPFVELTDGLSSPEAAALVPRIGANVPVLMTHGVDDDKVPIKLAKQSFKHLRQTMFKWRDIQQQLQHEDEADVEEEGASVPRPILDLTLKVYPDLKHSLGQMGLKDVYTFIAQKLPPLLPSARKQTTKSTPTRPWKDEL